MAKAKSSAQFELIPTTQVAVIEKNESDWPKDYVDQFWKRYPRRIAKQNAVKKLTKIESSGGVAWQMFIESVERYAIWAYIRGEIQFVKHPATWLNGGCWEDELTIEEFSNGQGRSRALQDDSLSASRAAGRLAEAARRGEYQLAPRPSLLPGPSEQAPRLLSKG